MLVPKGLGGRSAKQQRARAIDMAFFGTFWGENTAIPAKMIAVNEVEYSLNLTLASLGNVTVLTNRPGLEKVTSQSTTSGASVVNISQIPVGSNTYIFLVDSNYKLYKCTGTAPALNPGSSIKTLEGEARVIPFNSYGIIFDGSYIKYTDGTDTNIAYDAGTADAAYQYNNLCADNDGSLTLDNSNSMIAQKITADTWTSGYKMPPTQCHVWLSKTESPTGSATARIYNAAGDTLYATSNTLDVSKLTTAAQKKTFTFSSANYDNNFTGFETGVQYMVAIYYADGDASKKVNVHYDTVASGGLAYYNDGSWHAQTTKDLLIGVQPGIPPKGDFGAVSNRRLFFVDPDEPGALQYTNVDSAFDYSTTNGGGSIAAVDDDANSYPIGGIMPHFGEVYVFGKAQQPYLCKLTGSSPSSYGLPPQFEAYTHHDAMTAIGADIWFMSGANAHNIKGVLEFGDLRIFGAGDSVQDKFKTYYSTSAFCGYHPPGGLYLVKLAGYDNTLVCHTGHPIVDEDIGVTRYPWTEWNFGSLTPTAFATIGGVLYIGMNDGNVYRLNSSLVQDDGVDFDVELTSRISESSTSGFLLNHNYVLLTSDGDTRCKLDARVNGKSEEVISEVLNSSDAPARLRTNVEGNSLQVRLHSFSFDEPFFLYNVTFSGRLLTRPSKY